MDLSGGETGGGFQASETTINAWVVAQKRMSRPAGCVGMLRHRG
jgi:hypothetical protein